MVANSFVRKYKFDIHWNKNYCKEISRMKKVVAQQFLFPLLNYLKSHSSSKVLDAGCGNGVHAEVLTSNSEITKGSFFVGIDVSLSVLRAAQGCKQTGWRFVRGNISKLPFGDGQFDAVFSFGVLGYTEDPFHSFSELCRVTKVGGLLGVWMYPKVSGMIWYILSFIRKVCRVTRPIGPRLIADCIVPFLGILPTCSKLSLANASWRQCREVVLVNIVPTQLFFPEPPEIEDWFVKNRIKIISKDNNTPITMWGEKC